MLRCAWRTLPVPEAAAALAATAGLLWLVGRWPWELWPVAGMAAAAVGAAVARFFDEPAASVVDTTPRALWWRTAARLLPAALVATVWVTLASVPDLQGAGRPGLLRLQGVAVILAAAAVATALRRHGHATPGAAVGGLLLPLLTLLALMNPAHEVLPLFPYGPDDAWTRATGLWTGAAVVAAAVLARSCVRTRRRRAPTLGTPPRR